MHYTGTMKDKKAAPKDEFTLRFKGGGLEQLRRLAKKYGIDEDNLEEVVLKGLKVLDLPDDTNVTIKRGGDAYIADIKEL